MAKAIIKRAKCIGGCGRDVLIKVGAECRKCRRARVLAGKRRIWKSDRSARGRRSKGWRKFARIDRARDL